MPARLSSLQKQFGIIPEAINWLKSGETAFYICIAKAGKDVERGFEEAFDKQDE